MALELMQVITEQGAVNQKEEPLIPDPDLIKLYKTMVLTRQFDDRMMKLQRQGRAVICGLLEWKIDVQPNRLPAGLESPEISRLHHTGTSSGNNRIAALRKGGAK